MDNMEHAYRTLGKFLAIASTVRVYQEVYGGNIPQSNIISLLNDLKNISDNYLYPKYVLENNSLLDDMDIVDDNNDVGC